MHVYATTETLMTQEEVTQYHKGFDQPQRFVAYRRTVADNPNNPVKDDEMGYFYLATLPGCCGVVVSHHSHLDVRWRGPTWTSQAFRDLKKQVARECGYTIMLATADAANIPAAGSFLKQYKVFDSFINKRTGHLVWMGLTKL